MRENITKVAERGERLDQLQDKTDNLAVSAQGFRRGANRVRKVCTTKYCLKCAYTDILLLLRTCGKPGTLCYPLYVAESALL